MSARLLALICFVGYLAAGVRADTLPPTGTIMPLWSGKAPGAIGDTPADIPTLTVYDPAPGTATGAAVVVCPGGGYVYLANHEGAPPAEMLNGVGITAFVLKYRLAPRYHYPIMQEDMMRAMRLVRYNASAWGLNPDKIGVMGFSAGGHMAAMAATCWDKGDAAATDPVDRVSSRPDLAMLLYPVITMKHPYCHQGSRDALLGLHPSHSLVNAMSMETRVTADTPPCFVVCTNDDNVVPAQNSLSFVTACMKNHVPVEFHMYLDGPHGFGLGLGNPVLSRWDSACILWLQHYQFAATSPSVSK